MKKIKSSKKIDIAFNRLCRVLQERHEKNKRTRQGPWANMKFHPEVEMDPNLLEHHELNDKYFDPYGTKANYDQLHADVERRGVYNAVIVVRVGKGKSMRLLVLIGNRRVRIAKALGLKSIPVKVVSNRMTVLEQEYTILFDNLCQRELNATMKAKMALAFYPDLYNQTRQRIEGKILNNPRGKNIPGRITRADFRKDLNMDDNQAKQTQVQVQDIVKGDIASENAILNIDIDKVNTSQVTIFRTRTDATLDAAKHQNCKSLSSMIRIHDVAGEALHTWFKDTAQLESASKSRKTVGRKKKTSALVRSILT